MYRLSFIISFLLLISVALFAQNPHGKGFRMDCAQCHSSGSWSFNTKSKFRHETTGFGLEGQHKNIECKACHTNLNFKKTSSSCVSCHSDMHNQTVGNDCARCHTTQSWIVENIAKIHDKTSFPLVGVHKTVNCNQCHKTDTKLRFNPLGQTCVDCHKGDFQKAKSPNHVKLNLSTDCASCHNTTVEAWKTRKFPDHNAVYPLTGGHAAIQNECEKCHKGSDYSSAPRECVGCHQANFNQAQNPNHQKLNLSTDCATCHTTNPGWAPASFAVHDQFYQLTGAHKTIANECAQCHKGGNYAPMASDCNSCHSANYAKTSNPNHAALKISNDCASCHTTNPNWSPAKFTQHNEFYPLVGAHSTLQCKQCHQNGTYKNTPTECKACHNQDYQKASNPNHVAIGLSTDCATCHTPTPGWKPSTFQHNSYPLTGAHKTITNCALCHKTADIKSTPTDCNACHNANYQAAQNPNHVKLALGTDCASCHSTNPSWEPAKFPQHNAIYPLTGAHSNLTCNQCHKNGTYANTPNTCNGCHNATYNASKSPNHAQLGISTDCASCHSTNPGWRPSTFNHNAFYPLTGAHAAAASNCAACHKTGDIKAAPTECNACHNTAFQASKNPNHAQLGISTDCASCHSTNPGWRPSTFNHNTVFPLTGAHTNATCAACHKTGDIKAAPTDCNACHNAAYQAAKNPNHASNGFSTDCASCHTTNPGWRPSTFNHNAFYPLTGAHSTTTCTACHKNGVYKNTPKDCNACHNANYQAAKNPNHVSGGFSTDCASCHTTNPGWQPATFNHNAFYPLTGAHTTTSCTACHKNGVYANTPTDCNSCHNAAFNASLNPNHKTVGLSTDCASCHTTNPGWRPSTFNHSSVYPLQGAHAAIASNCTACHKTGNVKAAPTTCYGCHTTDYNTATPNHLSAGFPTNCTSCHSQNAWSPSTWNHDAQYFPIYSGKHKGRWTNCNECHTTAGNFSVFNCLNCHQKAVTDSHHRGINGYSYNSLACYSCHPRGSS